MKKLVRLQHLLPDHATVTYLTKCAAVNTKKNESKHVEHYVCSYKEKKGVNGQKNSRRRYAYLENLYNTADYATSKTKDLSIPTLPNHRFVNHTT